MRSCKRLCALLLTLAAVLALPMNALAAGAIDLTRDVRLSLTCQNGETALAGAQFSIYLVATVNAYGELTAADAFRDYSVDIRGKNDAAWRTLADTLEGYVLRDGIAPADSGKTDALGRLTFPTGSGRLTPGLYLVVGQRHTQNGTRYDPSPFMALLPSQDTQANQWVYNVAAAPKSDKSDIPETPEDDTVSRRVLKVWKDSGDDRPQSITVQLLRDGKVCDTVTLSEKNNWRYSWSDLDAGYTWRVVEQSVPDGYSVSVSREGVTFVITNTSAEAELPEEPDTPDLPDTPEQPSKPGTPDSPDTPKKPTLPQTGQLWWPVPVLAASGLLLIAAGLLRRRGDADEA